MRMSIRWKLLALFLLVAFLPLGISAYFHHRAFSRLGHHLATETRALLTESAHAQLETLVTNFGQLQLRDLAALEATLHLQKNDIERRLATGQPLAGAFETRVTWGVQPILRRIIVLKSGKVLVGPSGAEIPPGLGADLLKHYADAEDGGMLWSQRREEGSGEGRLVAVLPLYASNQEFVGITGIEFSSQGWLDALELPPSWGEGATRRLMVLIPTHDGPGWRLQTVATEAQESLADKRLLVDDPVELADLMAEIRTGRPGSRLIRSQGQLTHWVYGHGSESKPFPLIIVPHEQIAAPAYAAEAHVRGRMVAEAKITGAIFLGATVLVLVLAFTIARKITRPLGRMAIEAERLASGDFRAKIDIRTGDELQKLGEVFNSLGPRLSEREKMASALIVAREVQQRLLPRSAPSIPGFDIAGHCLFSDETGGDYYDFIDVGGKLAVAVGDVTGHGIGAALIMAEARATLRSYVDSNDPATLFRKLNRHLTRDLDDQQFMTLFYAELDVASRVMQWTSAGHGPVFLYRRLGSGVEMLNATGIPLGIMEAAEWSTAGPLVLDDGDVLLIGTDGLWESRNPAGQMFGVERLGRLLTDWADHEATDLCAAILRHIQAFREGGLAEDDVTLVVIRAVSVGQTEKG
jgi:phosphoserine phosphatase RsbU/P